MKTVYLYEAFDGKIFDNEDDCAVYEAVKLHSNLFHITFIDKDNKPYGINPIWPFEDNTYNHCEQINVPADAFDDFKWLTEECGWCEFEQITKPGRWKRTITEESSIYDEGVWVYIGEK